MLSIGPSHSRRHGRPTRKLNRLISEARIRSYRGPIPLFHVGDFQWHHGANPTCQFCLAHQASRNTYRIIAKTLTVKRGQEVGDLLNKFQRADLPCDAPKFRYGWVDAARAAHAPLAHDDRLDTGFVP